MADLERFEYRFANACSYALAKFELGEFKEKQNEALKELILGRDTFVILPTESGKSLIFQAFLIVLDHMESRPQHSIVVVIFPLLSLMKDQVNYLQSKVLKAAYISEGQYEAKKDIEKGKYQIVYGSPETFLATSCWRKMLSGQVYRENLRLIAVDEAHCISH